MALKNDAWKMIKRDLLWFGPELFEPGKLCEISGGVGGLELQLG